MKKVILSSLVALLVLSTSLSFAESVAEKRISRYPVPEVNEMPDDLKEGALAAQERAGFIPNVMLALAHRPAEARAFMGYAQALQREGSGLTEAEREMIVVAHSSYNGCTYCVVSHGASLRMLTKNPLISEQIAANYHEADITDRQKAMLDFAIKVTADSKSINEQDFEILRGHGLSDEDIWDIAALTAFFNMSNRMMNFLGVRPDLELSKMGRE